MGSGGEGVHGKDINRKDINAYFAKNAKDIKSILFLEINIRSG